MLRLINRHRSKKKGFSFKDEEGHLNDAGVVAYVQLLKQEKAHEIPEDLKQHVNNCPECQHKIVDFFELIENEEFIASEITDFQIEKSKSYFTPSLRIAASIFILLGLWMVYVIFQSSPENTSLSLINPPFENVNVDFQELDMNVSEVKTILLPNGSNIHVPANAFVHENGTLVDGKVILHYREFHQAADLIASGIPLSYDSLNRTYPFETVGMFEIRATQNGQPVYLADGKNIEVQFRSADLGDGFNHYYLDESAHQQDISQIELKGTTPAYADTKFSANWQYLGKSIIVSHNEPMGIKNKKTFVFNPLKNLNILDDLIDDSEEEITEISPNNVSQKDYFQLSLNSQVDGLSDYKEIVWEYVGEDKSQSPNQENSWIFEENWDKIDIYPSDFIPTSLKGHTGSIRSATFSPEGSQILTASEDATCKVWNLEGEEVVTLSGHSAPINKAVFAKQGNYIVSASEDATAKIWERDGRLRTTLQGHQSSVIQVTCSPNGQYILTASEDNTSKLWTSQGELVKTFEHQAKVHSAEFSSDGEYILTAALDSTAKVWSVKENYQLEQIINQNITSASFSEDGQYILGVLPDYSFALWKIDGELLRIVKDRTDFVTFFNHDSQVLTLAGKNARVWTIYERLHEIILKNNLIGLTQQGSSRRREAHENTVSYAGFSPNNDHIVTASADKTAKIWDADGNLLSTLRGHQAGINTAEFSPNGNLILTASADKTAKIWRKNTRKNTIYEIELLKESHHKQDRNGKVAWTKPKSFYTMARKVSKSETLINSDSLPKLYSERVTEAYSSNDDLSVVTLPESDTFSDSLSVSEKPKMVFRKFNVKKFGIYSVNKIYHNTSHYTLEADFDFSRSGVRTKYTIPQINIYLITGKYENVIIRYSDKTWKYFQFNPDDSNVLVAILPKNYVSLFVSEDFATVPSDIIQEEGKYTFQFFNSQRIQSMKELYSLL